MQTHTLAALLATGLTFAAVAPAAEADIIIPTSEEIRIADLDGDGVGDDTANSGGFLVGGGATDVTDFRPFWEFNLAASAAEIAAASPITFAVTVTGMTNNVNLGSIQLVALSGTEDGSINSADFHADGVVVATFDTTGLSVNDVLMADVTSFVQDDAAAGWSTFRMQTVDTSVYANTAGVADIIRFGDVGSSGATLTVVPEPASVAMLGLAGAACLFRRRH